MIKNKVKLSLVSIMSAFEKSTTRYVYAEIHPIDNSDFICGYLTEDFNVTLDERISGVAGRFGAMSNPYLYGRHINVLTKELDEIKSKLENSFNSYKLKEFKG